MRFTRYNWEKNLKTNKVSLWVAAISVMMLLMSCSTQSIQPEITQPTVTLPEQVATPDISGVVLADEGIEGSLETTAIGLIGGILQNLLGNGGFESNLAGWTTCGGAANLQLSDDKYAGSKAGRLSNGCMYQSVPVTAGDEIALGCYAKALGSGWSGMGMAFSDSSWNNLLDAPSVAFSSLDYLFYNSVAVAPSNAAHVSVWMHTDNVALLDDCLIGVTNGITDPQVGPVNVLSNPTFDNGTAAWSSCGGDNYSIVDSAAASNVLRVSKDCVYQSQEIEAGKDYKVSCDATGGTDAWASMTYTYYDSNWNSLNQKLIPVNSVSMTNYNATVTAPSNAAYAALTLYTEGVGLFDNCALVGIASSTPSNGCDAELNDLLALGGLVNFRSKFDCGSSLKADLLNLGNVHGCNNSLVGGLLGLGGIVDLTGLIGLGSSLGCNTSIVNSVLDLGAPSGFSYANGCNNSILDGLLGLGSILNFGSKYGCDSGLIGNLLNLGASHGCNSSFLGGLLGIKQSLLQNKLSGLVGLGSSYGCNTSIIPGLLDFGAPTGINYDYGCSNSTLGGLLGVGGLLDFRSSHGCNGSLISGLVSLGNSHSCNASFLDGILSLKGSIVNLGGLTGIGSSYGCNTSVTKGLVDFGASYGNGYSHGCTSSIIGGILGGILGGNTSGCNNSLLGGNIYVGAHQCSGSLISNLPLIGGLLDGLFGGSRGCNKSLLGGLLGFL